MDLVVALVALAITSTYVATAGVRMIDQRPRAGAALMWAGIGAIVVAECVLPLQLLLV